MFLRFFSDLSNEASDGNLTIMFAESAPIYDLGERTCLNDTSPSYQKNNVKILSSNKMVSYVAYIYIYTYIYT